MITAFDEESESILEERNPETEFTLSDSKIKLNQKKVKKSNNNLSEVLELNENTSNLIQKLNLESNNEQEKQYTNNNVCNILKLINSNDNNPKSLKEDIHELNETHRTIDNDSKSFFLKKKQGKRNNQEKSDDKDYIHVEKEYKKTENDKNGSKRKKRKSANQTLLDSYLLEKNDGDPFWRKEIQFEFLDNLFSDENAVFTNVSANSLEQNNSEKPKINFFELYLKTICDSSKCSKILKERLNKDKNITKIVSKICFLINAGRLSSTVNFIPELKSTIRTFHTIPSLQIDSQTGLTQSLQDTPRLKSILKLASDNNEEIKDLDFFFMPSETKLQNFNVIQLIFLFQKNYKLSLLDEVNNDVSNQSNNLLNILNKKKNINFDFSTFSQFFLDVKIHPKNKCQRFLWLIYTYLETDLSLDSIKKNPFGGENIPDIELISDNMLNKIDLDTDLEIEFSVKMYNYRLKHLSDEDHTNSKNNENKKDIHNNLNNKDNPLNSNQMNQHKVNIIDTINSNSETITNNDLKLKVHTNSKTKVTTNDSVKVKKKLNKKNFENDNNNLLNNMELIEKKISNSIENDQYSDTSIEIKNLNDFLNMDINLNSSKINFLESVFDSIVKKNSEFLYNYRYPNVLSLMLIHKSIIIKSKPAILHVRNSSKASTASFNKKNIILSDWIYRYFSYKKKIGNKLLGMEWEDLRYDLINGVEVFLYDRIGNSLNFNYSIKVFDYVDEIDNNNKNLETILNDLNESDSEDFINSIQKVLNESEISEVINKINKINNLTNEDENNDENNSKKSLNQSEDTKENNIIKTCDVEVNDFTKSFKSGESENSKHSINDYIKSSDNDLMNQNLNKIEKKDDNDQKNDTATINSEIKAKSNFLIENFNYYEPIHDFDKINEKNSFILQLISYSNKNFLKKIINNDNLINDINEKIHFDFDNDSIDFPNV